MRVSRLFLWIAGSAVPLLLAGAGLGLLTWHPFGPSAVEFVLELILIVVAWVSFVTLHIALLCWLAGKMFGRFGAEVSYSQHPHFSEAPAPGVPAGNAPGFPSGVN